MLFKKKYHTLHRERLANAISIYSDKVNPNIDKLTKINEVIMLNDVLKISIPYMNYMGGNYYRTYNMDVETYVEGIKMATYVFELDTRVIHDFHKTWKCKKADIIHYMPNQFIDLMNEWSEQIVSKYEKQQNEIISKKEKAKQNKFDREESILKKYR